MTFLLKDKFHQSLSETLYNEFLSRRSNYYYFIGKAVEWNNPAVPDTPDATQEYEYYTRNNILSVKRITVNDISLVANRVDWAANTVYDYYDGNYSESYPAFSGATNIKEANYYVLTSTFNVYKCIFNNNDAQSTVQPTGSDPTPVTTADGYIWKYLYTIPLSLRNRFLTTAYMPVQRAVTNAFYSNGQISSIVIDNAGNNYTNANTTIVVTGNGTGANLSPFINGSGQLQDIIINAKGIGYTFANLAINGDGSNANAYVNLTVGGLNTLQSIVELSAINGSIYSFRVNNVGSGYSYANVVVAGDGSNFVGNVILTNNTVSYIAVSNPGVGYTYANVSITGDGANANVSAILSPYGGHGRDAIGELNADTIMLTTTINNDKNHNLTVNNDYRQFGIIKDLNGYNSTSSFANVNGSGAFLVTMDTITGLDRDLLLSHTATGSTRYFEIIEYRTNTKQLLLSNLNNHELEANDVLTDVTTNLNYVVVSVDKTPDINKFSGDLLFIDNRTSVSYNDQQLVTLRTVIKL
jgi:hypothetical protein